MSLLTCDFAFPANLLEGVIIDWAPLGVKYEPEEFAGTGVAKISVGPLACCCVHIPVDVPNGQNHEGIKLNSQKLAPLLGQRTSLSSSRSWNGSLFDLPHREIEVKVAS